MLFHDIRRRFGRWRERHTTLKRLAALDDRLLADLGASRDNLEAFVDGADNRNGRIQ